MNRRQSGAGIRRWFPLIPLILSCAAAAASFAADRRGTQWVSAKPGPDPAAAPVPIEQTVSYSDLIKPERWGGLLLPEPHRVEPGVKPSLPFAVPMRPDSGPAGSPNWAQAKVYEAEEVFVVRNRGTYTQNAFLDVLIYPTTPWQKTTILSSTLPVVESFYDGEGNAWLRVCAGPMLPGEQREQSLRMRVCVAKMSLEQARRVEKRGAKQYAPHIARFLSDQSPGEAARDRSGTEDVTRVARKVTAGVSGDYAKARAIYQWMRRTIRYETPGHGSGDGHSALVRRRAACGGQARLFVGLCRSAGVPAREIYGRNAGHRDGSITSHAWAEFYVLGYGWVPADTSTSRFAASSPWHVTRTTDFSLRYMQLISIPSSHHSDASYEAGGIVVVTADGEVAPYGDWELVSLHTALRMRGRTGASAR